MAHLMQRLARQKFFGIHVNQGTVDALQPLHRKGQQEPRMAAGSEKLKKNRTIHCTPIKLLLHGSAKPFF